MTRLIGLNWHKPTLQNLTVRSALRGATVVSLLMLCGACQSQSVSESKQSSEGKTAPSASSSASGAKSTDQSAGTALKMKVASPSPQSTKSAAVTAKAVKSEAKATIQLVSSPAFQQGLDKAESAASISASAQSPEDWQLVENQWKEAIALMKQVPPNDTNRKSATQQIAQMQAGLARTQQKLDRLKNGGSASSIATGPASEPRLGIYRAMIKRYTGGIPVVDVMFNGRDIFEMMVDTGASGTMITEGMAQQLRVKPVGAIEAMTPSGRTQFNVGYIDSMSVGGGSIRSFPVAIGPVALLGHDFFGDCNISIKRDQDIVEFSQCKN